MGTVTDIREYRYRKLLDFTNWLPAKCLCGRTSTNSYKFIKCHQCGSDFRWDENQKQTIVRGIE